MTENAVTPPATDLDVVGCYAAIAPWRECCATDAARIAAHRGECGDDRLDDDDVAIIILVVESDAAVMPLNFTHGRLPYLMVNDRSDRLGLRRTQTVDSIFKFEPLLAREGREPFANWDTRDIRRSLLGRRRLPIERR